MEPLIKAEFESLKSNLERLTRTVNAMLIKDAGITELDGDYIDVYNDAARIVDHRTQYALVDKLRRKEIDKIEIEIDKLREKANSLRQDAGLPMMVEKEYNNE